MMKMIKASLSFLNGAPVQILARANAIYAGMKDNPAFLNLPFDLALLKSGIDGLSTAITEALDGGRKAIAERNHLTASVGKMLRQLAHHVEAACDGDVKIFLSSGFEAVSTTRTPSAPVSSVIRAIDPGSASGQMLVSLVYDPAAFAYEVRYSPAGPNGTPGAWTSQSVGTSRPPVLIDGLTPGTFYVFQARVLEKSSFGAWSDPLMRICT